MKATGIVRRIDDLGRVVIPKEIRKTLRIKEGTQILYGLKSHYENYFSEYRNGQEPGLLCNKNLSGNQPHTGNYLWSDSEDRSRCKAHPRACSDISSPAGSLHL